MKKFKIEGAPIVNNRYGGRKKWQNDIISQTKNNDKVSYPCHIEVEFILEHNQFPKDRLHGPDVDNLLKKLFDAFKQTFLEDDSLVYSIIATKRRCRIHEHPGVIVLVKKHLENRNGHLLTKSFAKMDVCP